jgi:hypothetical protein
MRRIKKTLSLDGDVTDGLAPFLDKIGMSLSAYVRFTLAQTFATFAGITEVVNYDKPASEITLGDLLKVTNFFESQKMIDLTDSMTDEELKRHKAKKK